MNSPHKHILVLARRDHAEAMRVAAGLTIFGHRLRLIFMDRAVEQTPENARKAELLELSEIVPETTVNDQEGLSRLDSAGLAASIAQAEVVLSL